MTRRFSKVSSTRRESIFWSKSCCARSLDERSRRGVLWDLLWRDGVCRYRGALGAFVRELLWARQFACLLT